jgi:glycosyltransferase involved in cell wall biosynthesis
MARIVMVYNTQRIRIAEPTDMARIQMLETARALVRLGHSVDIATAELTMELTRRPIVMERGLRRVPLSRVRWREYDVVETNFHQGWETLARYRGTAHPFIIAKLGSVVGATDMAGIYYFGRDRERMYATQRAIHDGARFITLLSRPAQDLWTESFGPRDGHLLVPGAAATHIPEIGPDPFPHRDRPRVIFSGNIYQNSQPEANRVLVDKLNTLGARLAPHAQLYFAGPGNVDRLDRNVVRYLGVAPYADSWQHMFHADVGIVVSAGAFMHNNESTKIYHYLRAGLPTVSEAGFPNDDVVRDAELGFVVPSDDMETMADRILEATRTRWNREAAVRFILEQHTWDARARIYDDVIRRNASTR